ncbi:MAG: helix-hairpin-helix domain-containing protein [Proteobacteria bacterium]|nr:helix-hairpin-helix domain-containing protein [Pseudomonadota bacterium]
MTTPRQRLARVLAPIAAALAIVASMGGSWGVARATPPASGPVVTPIPTPTPPEEPAPPPKKPTTSELVGKLNLNTATEAQLLLLPTVGPSKADRIVAWRKKNGGFKRPADLRRVKGFGYKTFKRLEPFLDIKGDTTLARR